VHGGELREDLPPAAGEAQLDLAPIGARRLAHDEFLLDEAVDELDGTVVLDEELLGEVADRYARIVGPAAQHQHRLVVLRGESRLRGGRLAEAQESAQRVAEGGELRVVARRQVESLLGFSQLHGAFPGARRHPATARPYASNIAFRYTSGISCPDILSRQARPAKSRHSLRRKAHASQLGFVRPPSP